jgi:hypothetical protein
MAVTANLSEMPAPAAYGEWGADATACLSRERSRWPRLAPERTAGNSSLAALPTGLDLAAGGPLLTGERRSRALAARVLLQIRSAVAWKPLAPRGRSRLP